jgi:hypothetical protein
MARRPGPSGTAALRQLHVTRGILVVFALFMLL